MSYQWLSELDYAFGFAPGDYVSFTFMGERITSYLVASADGLYSNEGVSGGYRPCVVLSNNTVAYGITSLRKIEETELVTRLATNLLLPENEHFVYAIEKACPRRGDR